MSPDVRAAGAKILGGKTIVPCEVTTWPQWSFGVTRVALPGRPAQVQLDAINVLSSRVVRLPMDAGFARDLARQLQRQADAGLTPTDAEKGNDNG